MNTLHKTLTQVALMLGITGICVFESNAKSTPKPMVGTYGCPSADEVHKFLNDMNEVKNSKSKGIPLHSASTNSDWVLDEAGKYEAGSKFQDVSLKAEITPDICAYEAVTEKKKTIKFIFRDAYVSAMDIPELKNVPIYNPFSDTTTEENFYTYEGRK